MADRPHILIFNPDQWRGNVLGHMGDPAAQTPVLDEFARTDAVSFRNAFCQNPVCTPSRCSFMSGWYPHVRGHRTMFHMMRPDEPVLLKTLKENGYFIWWGGKNDLVPAQNRYDDYKYVKRLYESDELYDLRADPGETTNRIDDPTLAGIRGALQERLLQFYLKTGDVVPHGTDQRN